MADTSLGFELPVVGGSAGTWGTILNDDLSEIDAELVLRLLKSGGVMSGNLKTLSASGALVAKGSITGGTVAFDLATAQAFTVEVGAAITTMTFDNPQAAPCVQGFVLYMTNPGAFAITWPASVIWSNAGAKPGLTAAGLDVLVFLSFDGGTVWNGMRTMDDVQL